MGEEEGDRGDFGSGGSPAQGGKEGPMRRLVFESAGRTEEFFDRLQAHYRECKRKDADAESDIRLILEDGSEFDVGTAHLKNVSPTGALLVDVKLSKGSYPAATFMIELRLRSGPYRGIGFRAEPVRFVPDMGGIGVRFEEIFVSSGRHAGLADSDAGPTSGDEAPGPAESDAGPTSGDDAPGPAESDAGPRSGDDAPGPADSDAGPTSGDDAPDTGGETESDGPSAP